MGKYKIKQANIVNHNAVDTSVFQPVDRRVNIRTTGPATANANIAQNHRSGLGSFLYGKRIAGVREIKAKIERTVKAIACLNLLFAFVIYWQEL